jgi:hypothetical protein
MSAVVQDKLSKSYRSERGYGDEWTVTELEDGRHELRNNIYNRTFRFPSTNKERAMKVLSVGHLERTARARYCNCSRCCHWQCSEFCLSSIKRDEVIDARERYLCMRMKKEKQSSSCLNSWGWKPKANARTTSAGRSFKSSDTVL